MCHPDSRRLPRLARLLGLLAVSALAAGCLAPEARKDREAPNTKLQVAATVPPHAWLVRQIAGDDFDVVSVLPTTADPHSHTPTDAEVSRLARSRVLFRAGVPFENGSWLTALEARGVRRVDLRRGIDLLQDEHGHSGPDHSGPDHDDHGHEHDAERGGDPHTWTSPRRLARQADTVAEELVRLRPDLAAPIERRAAAVRQGLESLDAELRTQLAELPNREFYVLHPSWSYFAADYGLEQVALEAGGSEPSDAELTAWLKRARDGGARVVFTQPQSADRSVRIAAEALAARVESLDPLAPDVPAQLRVTAERLLAAHRES